MGAPFCNVVLFSQMINCVILVADGIEFCAGYGMEYVGMSFNWIKFKKLAYFGKEACYFEYISSLIMLLRIAVS